MLRFAITDRTLFSSASSHVALVARCAQLASENVDYLLLRESDLSAGELTTLARAIHQAVRAQTSKTRILIASRPDIALAASLDGVHLTSSPSELTPAQVRTLFRRAHLPPPILTRSCHTLDDIRQARIQQIDLALFAPVFGKIVQGRQVTLAVGLQALGAASREAAPMPVLALGGVTRENAQSCLHAGAAGVAAIRWFMTP